MHNAAPRPLLGQDDPPPVELVNEASDHPLVLVCEHAGQAIPKALNGLGLSRDNLDSHVGWDIGAEAVTRHMAQALGAPAVIQPYSRLVIDCNRPPDAPDAMPAANHGVTVPGNQALDTPARNARICEIFEPFHAAVANCIARHPRRIVVAIHSFTPSLGGHHRPWHIGFLFRKDTETSGHLGRFISDADPGLTVGMNQPYQIDDGSDWFVPHHGEAGNIPHSLIEIRNDLICETAGQASWAKTLGAAIDRYLKEV
ncbi:N-formylglutamate amidohydrolase [uncultured Roseovarius sp.]|uniref:N-formylglutamate amidohydrolase n=1 Tax=uncultured Roseovarius sp. TaxID=293344 RepID=UPI002606EC19|nr:N-formylglutamate amidohydrolase [uncultured Roseovarius sp.]